MLTISPIRNNSNKQNNSTQAFGLNYTKGTVKYLKRAALAVSGEGEYPIARKAIEILGELRNRPDGLLLDINGDESILGLNIFSRMSLAKGRVVDSAFHDRVVDWDLKRCGHSEVCERLIKQWGRTPAISPSSSSIKEKMYYHYLPTFGGYLRARDVSDAQDLLNVSRYLESQEFLDYAHKYFQSAPKHDSPDIVSKVSDFLSRGINSTFDKVVEFSTSVNFSPEGKAARSKVQKLRQLIDEKLGTK